MLNLILLFRLIKIMKNKTAIITGASSGIGKSFAYKLAEKGYDLLLIGRREELLKNICLDIEFKFQIKAQYLIIELANKKAMKVLVERILSSEVDILVNNAGFGLRNDFLKTEESIDMIKVHNEATVELTFSAIKSMIERKSGAIINVSSIAGFLISPNDSMYCATKAFLISFTESLHLKLKDYNIKLQALCPGFTHTDFHEKIGYDKNNPVFKSFMSSDKVVEISLKYLDKGKVICVPGFKYKLGKLIVSLLPRGIFYKSVLFYSKFNKQNKK